jgi:hypothetical protein
MGWPSAAQTNPEVQALVGRVTTGACAPFGFNAQADVRATRPNYENGVAQFDVVLQSEDDRIEGMTLPMPATTTCRTRSPPSPWRGTSG